MVSSVDGMSAMDGVTTMVFGIGLPSWDVYSDIFFAYTLMKVECRYWSGAVYPHKIINDETECKKLGHFVGYYGHTKFGILALSPVFFSFLFTLSHWWKLEGNWKKRLMSLPFLLLQCWPQYRMARILYLGLWKKDKMWRSEKETMERNVGCVGR